MIFLQAAIGLGLLIMVIFGGGIFIGIPLLSVFLYRCFRRKKELADVREKNRAKLVSFLVATAIISLLLYLIWTCYLSKVDLTYS